NSGARISSKRLTSEFCTEATKSRLSAVSLSMSLVIVFLSHQTSLVERNRRILARSVRPASAAVAKAGFGGGREPAARLHYRSKEKMLSGLCHCPTNLALMRLDCASVVWPKQRARHARFVERLLREVTRFLARPAPVN